MDASPVGLGAVLTQKQGDDYRVICYAKKSKKWCKDQESIQSSTTPDPGYQWESDKLTEDTTNEGQEVSPFPAGDHKAHINRRAQNIANTRQNKNIQDPQKKYRLGMASRSLTDTERKYSQLIVGLGM